MSRGVYAATLGTALGCGLMSGVFFAFSSFVMPALGRLSAAQGIAAMQSINARAESSVFLLAFMGTTAACAGVVVVAAVRWGDPSSPWMLAGGTVFLLGAFALTAGHHVPLNNALASVDPHAADAAGRWARYLTDWNAWNHVRGAAALASAGLLTAALHEA